jgi:hypothetical protein
MPLLRRQPFVPQPPPLDIRPEEEIFYFPVTNEIFRDYEYVFAFIQHKLVSDHSHACLHIVNLICYRFNATLLLIAFYVIRRFVLFFIIPVFVYFQSIF